jgi:Leucine-rich repeat (LRR) protein
MSPINIYTLYEINNQAIQIINTYEDYTKEIIINGDTIFLYFQLNNNEKIITKEKYYIFLEYISNILREKNDISNKILNIIKRTHDYFFEFYNKSILNYDKCRLTIDLGKFKKLEKIKLVNLYLYELKNIPSTVDTIDVEYCHLKKIEKVPCSLKYFYCNNNEITKLPILKDTILEVLDFKNNNVYSIPYLPNTIKYLIFNNNHIINIPNFPLSLKYLECSRNNIDNIDSIPKDINTIICDHNNIYKLPCLSKLSFLKTLLCNSNYIKELPPLPGLIDYINFSDNPISIFVPFPFSLIE